MNPAITDHRGQAANSPTTAAGHGLLPAPAFLHGAGGPLQGPSSTPEGRTLSLVCSGTADSRTAINGGDVGSFSPYFE